uniref:Uncharacterized protein n=1 Tax=Emiliania huxleyi TaxID=2903 RepID=A0A7S3RH35_EMIHU
MCLPISSSNALRDGFLPSFRTEIFSTISLRVTRLISATARSTYWLELASNLIALAVSGAGDHGQSLIDPRANSGGTCSSTSLLIVTSKARLGHGKSATLPCRKQEAGRPGSGGTHRSNASCRALRAIETATPLRSTPDACRPISHSFDTAKP